MALPISQVGSVTSAVDGDVDGTLVVSKPTGVAQNDLMFSFVQANSGTLGAPSGWTQEYYFTGGGGVQFVCYSKLAGSSEPTSYTWTKDANSNNTIWGVAVVAFRGIDTSNPFVISSTSGGDLTEPVSCPDIDAQRISRIVSVRSLRHAANNSVSITLPGGEVNTTRLINHQTQTPSGSTRYVTAIFLNNDTAESGELTGIETQHAAGGGSESDNVLATIALYQPVVVSTTEVDLAVDGVGAKRETSTTSIDLSTAISLGEREKRVSSASIYDVAVDLAFAPYSLRVVDVPVDLDLDISGFAQNLGVHTVLDIDLDISTPVVKTASVAASLDLDLEITDDSSKNAVSAADSSFIISTLSAPLQKRVLGATEIPVDLAIDVENSGVFRVSSEISLQSEISAAPGFKSSSIPAEIPLEVGISGEPGKHVSAASEISVEIKTPDFLELPHFADTFTRTVASGGWGSPWVIANAGSLFSVNGSRGIVSQPGGAANSNGQISIPDVPVDFDLTLKTKLGVTPANANITSEIRTRIQNTGASEANRFILTHTTAGNLNITFAVDSTGIQTVASALTGVENTDYYVRCQSIGTSHKIKAWKASTSEPSSWNIEVSDSTNTTSGLVGSTSGATNFRLMYLHGVSNPHPSPYQWQVDDLTISAFVSAYLASMHGLSLTGLDLSTHIEGFPGRKGYVATQIDPILDLAAAVTHKMGKAAATLSVFPNIVPRKTLDAIRVEISGMAFRDVLIDGVGVKPIITDAAIRPIELNMAISPTPEATGSAFRSLIEGMGF